MKQWLFSTFTVLMLASGLYGCGGDDQQAMLMGSWQYSLYVPPAEAAKLSEEPLPEGASMELTATGTQTFHRGGKYNVDLKYTLRLKQGTQELPLRFSVRDAGTWEIHDNVLVETSSDSVVVPLDDITKRVVAEAPELKTMLTPITGESESVKIVHLSDSSAEFEMMEPPFLRLTFKKLTKH